MCHNVTDLTTKNIYPQRGDWILGAAMNITSPTTIALLPLVRLGVESLQMGKAEVT